MALIQCPECSRQVSDKAPACPQCGYPVARALSSPPSKPVPVAASKTQPQQGGPQITAPSADGKDNLREIAVRQRYLLYSLLVNLVNLIPINIMAFVPQLAPLALISTLVTVGLNIWCVVKLAQALKLPVPWIWAPTMLMPCISLLFLLIINGMATSALKKAGIHVGLMGADPNRI